MFTRVHGRQTWEDPLIKNFGLKTDIENDGLDETEESCEATPKPRGMAKPATEMAREALAFLLGRLTSNSMATVEKRKTRPMEEIRKICML
jgi:hypothetical protein